jgi:hypothetical protein
VSTWTPSWSPRRSGLMGTRNKSSTDHFLLEARHGASSPTRAVAWHTSAQSHAAIAQDMPD